MQRMPAFLPLAMPCHPGREKHRSTEAAGLARLHLQKLPAPKQMPLMQELARRLRHQHPLLQHLPSHRPPSLPLCPAADSHAASFGPQPDHLPALPAPLRSQRCHRPQDNARRRVRTGCHQSPFSRPRDLDPRGFACRFLQGNLRGKIAAELFTRGGDSFINACAFFLQRTVH